MAAPKGHKRYGGRAKGTLNKKTVAEKVNQELYREQVRQFVTANLQPMLEAQLEHSKGVQYMVLRMPDGTYARATDVKQIDAACAVGASAFKIMTQAPNTQAFVALMDRALDKPREQPQDINIKGTIDIPALLRQRFAKRKKAE